MNHSLQINGQIYYKPIHICTICWHRKIMSLSVYFPLNLSLRSYVIKDLLRWGSRFPSWSLRERPSLRRTHKKSTNDPQQRCCMGSPNHFSLSSPVSTDSEWPLSKQFWAHLHQSILFFGRSWWTNPLHSLCHSIVEEVLCHRQYGRLCYLINVQQLFYTRTHAREFLSQGRCKSL